MKPQATFESYCQDCGCKTQHGNWFCDVCWNKKLEKAECHKKVTTDQAKDIKYRVDCAGLSGKVVDDLFPSLALRAAVINIINRDDVDVLEKALLINIEYTTLR